MGRNRAEASLERAQNLNPMVDVKADAGNVDAKAEEFFTQFDAVRWDGVFFMTLVFIVPGLCCSCLCLLPLGWDVEDSRLVGGGTAAHPSVELLWIRSGGSCGGGYG